MRKRNQNLHSATLVLCRPAVPAISLGVKLVWVTGVCVGPLPLVSLLQNVCVCVCVTNNEPVAAPLRSTLQIRAAGGSESRLLSGCSLSRKCWVGEEPRNEGGRACCRSRVRIYIWPTTAQLLVVLQIQECYFVNRNTDRSMARWMDGRTDTLMILDEIMQRYCWNFHSEGKLKEAYDFYSHLTDSDYFGDLFWNELQCWAETCPVLLQWKEVQPARCRQGVFESGWSGADQRSQAAHYLMECILKWD